MIKQIYTTFLLSFVLLAVQAQERSFDSTPVITKQSTSLKAQKDASRAVIDSVEVVYPTWNDDCSNTLTNFEPNGAWGRVSGMNQFLDLAKAQQLEFISDSYRILGGICYFSQASVIGDGEFQMNFYEVDELTGAPGTMLASSLPRNVSDIILPDTFLEATIFVVPQDMQPSLSTANFFAGVEFGGLYATQDSIAVFQTNQDCGDGTNTWELQSSPDTSWIDISSSWGLNADFAITAIVEFDELASNEDFIKTRGITLYPAFPNPADDNIVFSFQLENTGEVTVDLIDQLGKNVYRSQQQIMQAGKNTFEMSLQAIVPGSYYYVITTKQGSIASRLVIQ